MNIQRQPLEHNCDSRIRVATTPDVRYGREYTADASRILSPNEFQQAYDFVRLLPGYQPTPLLERCDFAEECRLSSVLIKNEGHRAPTHSFKMLGPPYALARQIISRLSLSLQDSMELVSGQLTARLQRLTVCAATSGNHGRALAWAAREFGCPCRIYMPESTGVYREEQIQRFGAATIRVAGNYDDSVNRAVLLADRHDHLLVGDGAAPNSSVLRHIIHGYSVVGEELLSVMPPDAMPTHVFIPAGSGSLAAAATARLWMECGDRRPKIVVVQPHTADSGYQSCLKSTRAPSHGNLATVMDGLSVRELSPPAWTILGSGAFAFITIDDQSAVSMLQQLAKSGQLTIGETGVAALAALKTAAMDPFARERLGLDQNSRVIVIVTEGVTDPQIVNELLARCP